MTTGSLVPVNVTAPLKPSRGGLFELLNMKPTPVTEWMRDNANFLTGLGTSLLSDGMDFSHMARGSAMDRQEASQRQEEERKRLSRQKLLTTLQNYGPGFEDIAEALASDLLDPKAAWGEMVGRHGQLKEQERLDGRNRGNAAFLQTPELKAAVESGAMTFAEALKLERGGGGATDYGMTPIWGSFADGSMGYGVQGSDGQFHPVDTGNFKPMDPRTLSSERAAGGAYGKGEGLNALNAPSAAVGLDQLNAKTDHVVQTIDKAIEQLSWDSTGLVGQTMGAFGGTKAYDLRKTAQTIKANLGFSELQAMRDASPTGGALGQVAVQELEALQSTLESLDANQSEDQLRENLKNVKVLLERQKEFRRQAFEAKYAAGANGAPAAAGPVPRVASQAQYDTLPSGAVYVAPDGTQRTKP